MILNRTWCDAVVVLVGGSLLGWAIWTLAEKGEEARRTFQRIAEELKRDGPSSDVTTGNDGGSKKYLPRNVIEHPSESANPIRLAQFNRLANGMPYFDVCAILGGPGKQISDSLLDGGMAGSIEASSYVWSNADGTNVVVLFKNHYIIGKSQSGLH
jgi:hypothetical protein